MDIGDAADQRIFHRDDDQVSIAGLGRLDGVFECGLGDRARMRHRFARRQIGIGARFALKGDTPGIGNGLDHDSSFRARSKSAGVSTDKGASSTRATAPGGEGTLYHHVGLYAYRREALESFVALPPSPLESREKLEQLRALEHGARIQVLIERQAQSAGVDVPDDIAKVEALLRAET